MSEQLVLKAKHFVTIFRNEASGYTVAKFITYDANEEDFVATGYFRDIKDDAIYELHGDYVDHPRYGMQFQVETYAYVKPNDTASLIRYFSSRLFPGIGKQTAMAIVDVLGKDAVENIKEDPAVLLQVDQLNEKKRAIIKKGIMDHDEMDDSIMLFTRLGVSVKNIMKIEAAYGEEAAAIIKENPYRMMEDIDGIGFKTADKLAHELAFAIDHPYRIRAALLGCVLESCMASGDTYTTQERVQRRMTKAFGLDVELASYLTALDHDHLIVMEEDRIYHHTQYEAEQGIATFLSQFPYEETHPVEGDLSMQLDKLQQHYHITYEAQQKQAIQAFFKESFSIITGGPGTGKTTIVQGILALCHCFYPSDRVALCAPTGRASKRLSELSDASAMTLHSLLKWNLETNTFTADEKEPIAYDILIVDEFSMVDQWLFYSLLKASHHVKKILLIGDEDQLPSVGPGCVLKDLIACKQFPLTRLGKIFRQSEGSDVVTLAHEIREGNDEVCDHAQDVAFFSCQNYEVKELVKSIVANAFEKGYEEKDIQVLAPMYGGVAGIDALNNALQQMINPSKQGKREIKIGYRIFREQDKVLQLKNQPDDGVFNGDIGTIVEIKTAQKDIHHQHHMMVDFDGTHVEYAGEQIYNITHAYCISIHKSQGSEYPIVIMPIVQEYRHMLQRRLIYTGVTRAKKSLILLGNRTVFQHAIQSLDRHVRKSTLGMRILEMFA